VTQRFDEWREVWRNKDGDQDVKFELYAKDDLATARKVYRQLALMALALFDIRAFEEQFGMKPQRFPDRVSRSFQKLRRTNSSRNQKILLVSGYKMEKI
jgi:hypothetical protein